MKKIISSVCALAVGLISSISNAEEPKIERFVPGVLVQNWYVVQEQDSEWANHFRIRRAEVSIKGDLIPQISYGVMVDFAKVLEFKEVNLPIKGGEELETSAKQPASPVSVLQDVYVTYKSPVMDFTIGQFKTPMSWEGYNSSSKLMFAERALVSREFGDKRDVGAKVSKTFEYVGYTVGMFNGAGLNNLETDDSKNGMMRLELYPIKGATVGGAVSGAVSERTQPGTRDVYEIDLRLNYGSVTSQTEYFHARTQSDNGEVFSNGFYTALGFKIVDELEPVVRVGQLDPDKNVVNNETLHFDVGLNVYLHKTSKLQLNYGHVAADGKAPVNQGIVAFQNNF